jgi:lysozyme
MRQHAATMKHLIALALCLVLAACGGARSSREPTAKAPPPAAAVAAPNFGDVDPTAWNGRPPSSYAVHGTDTSRYQSAVDWRTARANGVNFVYVKSSEGADDIDPMFRDHWRGARSAGIRTGAYHFWYHCAPGRDQAHNFIARVPRSPGALPPVLDIEWTPFSPTCTRRTPTEELLREAQSFVDTVARHYGQRPIIYVSPDIFRERELSRLRGVDFWLRSVAGHPSEIYPGQRWTFWQYSGTGSVPGIAGKADLNVFNGGAAAWSTWLASNAQ